MSSYRSLGHGDYRIDIIAVATRLRGRGRGWALEALTTTMDFISADADADGYTLVTLAADIHEQNRASQRLFEGQSFVPTGTKPEGYQVWSLEMAIAGAFDAD